MIAIIDYGMGNLHSVSKAVERLGYDAMITASSDRILTAEAAILPGVGAFGDAMAQLKETGLDQTVISYAESGKPLLGICLGMQLLFSRSEEHGEHTGLNLLPGEVVRFQGDFKIPHMGWNQLHPTVQSPLFDGIEQDGFAYFVHSYHVKAERQDDVLATTDYYGAVTAVVGRGSIYGMQFHPEKSGKDGMRLLHNFLKLSEMSKINQL